MGRMIDILRTADRRPAAPDTVPMRKAVAPIQIQESEDRDQESEDRISTLTPDPSLLKPGSQVLEDDNDVPFIEVGGPREAGLRLVAAEKSEVSSQKSEVSEEKTEDKEQKTEIAASSSLRLPAAPADLAPALFTIRFQPVHAARLGGRGPVAELIAFHQPDHTISVQYRSLTAEIARQLPGTLPRVLLFTGAAGGLGTSTVVLNLAMTLARQDAKVTIVDAHLSRPALAARLGLPDGPGLREVLAGPMPPAWCLQETAHPNLFVLPAGTAGEPKEETDLGAIVELLRGRSDCVLLDAGPWGDGAIATQLAASSDAVYLVLSHDAAATPETAALQEEILTKSGRLRGCVLTQR